MSFGNGIVSMMKECAQGLKLFVLGDSIHERH